MNKNDALEVLTKAGIDVDAAAGAWRDAQQLLSALDAISRDGANALVKVDGGRSNGDVYTVVLSGGRLGEEFFRKDGSDLQCLLGEAIGFYAAHISRDG